MEISTEVKAEDRRPRDSSRPHISTEAVEWADHLMEEVIIKTSGRGPETMGVGTAVEGTMTVVHVVIIGEATMEVVADVVTLIGVATEAVEEMVEATISGIARMVLPEGNMTTNIEVVVTITIIQESSVTMNSDKESRLLTQDWLKERSKPIDNDYLNH